MRVFRIGTVSAVAGAALVVAVSAANADGPRDTPFSWTGLYVGAAVGSPWGSIDIGQPVDTTFPVRGSEGVLAAGYDFRLGPSLVAGVTVDIALVGPGIGLATIDNQLAIGGRLGVLAIPSALLYASAGYTRADLNSDTLGASLEGYFVGVGVEYLVRPNLSLKVDYRFSDHEAFEVDSGKGFAPAQADFHSFRLGVNWRFGPLR
jgi:outer membrane immunogenic protein